MKRIALVLSLIFAITSANSTESSYLGFNCYIQNIPMSISNSEFYLNHLPDNVPPEKNFGGHGYLISLPLVVQIKNPFINYFTLGLDITSLQVTTFMSGLGLGLGKRGSLIKDKYNYKILLEYHFGWRDIAGEVDYVSISETDYKTFYTNYANALPRFPSYPQISFGIEKVIKGKKHPLCFNLDIGYSFISNEIKWYNQEHEVEGGGCPAGWVCIDFSPGSGEYYPMDANHVRYSIDEIGGLFIRMGLTAYVDLARPNNTN